MFSKSVQDLIIEAYKKKSITSKTQSVFSTLSFYIAVRDLKKLGILELDGSFSPRGQEKRWRLTEKGKKLAKLLIKIRELLKE